MITPEKTYSQRVPYRGYEVQFTVFSQRDGVRVRIFRCEDPYSGTARERDIYGEAYVGTVESFRHGTRLPMKRIEWAWNKAKKMVEKALGEFPDGNAQFDARCRELDSFINGLS